jgi:hypothetical protein
MTLAHVLDNVTAPREEAGISRTVFYRWRLRFEWYGADGLRPRRHQATGGRPPALPRPADCSPPRFHSVLGGRIRLFRTVCHTRYLAHGLACVIRFEKPPSSPSRGLGRRCQESETRASGDWQALVKFKGVAPPGRTAHCVKWRVEGFPRDQDERRGPCGWECGSPPSAIEYHTGRIRPPRAALALGSPILFSTMAGFTPKPT